MAALILDGLLRHTLRDATSGARCNVRPPCQRRIAFSVLHAGCAARATCLSMRNEPKIKDLLRTDQRKDHAAGKE